MGAALRIRGESGCADIKCNHCKPRNDYSRNYQNNSLENPLVFDVENGFLEVKNDTGWLARLATGILWLEGKDSGTNRQRLSVTNGGLSYRQPDMDLGSDLIFRDKDVVIAPTGEAEFPIVESLKKC